MTMLEKFQLSRRRGRRRIARLRVGHDERRIAVFARGDSEIERPNCGGESLQAVQPDAAARRAYLTFSHRLRLEVA